MQLKTISNGLLVLFFIGLSTQVYAATAKIAVAANFTKTIEKIGLVFEKQTKHQVKFAFGPTGKLYAQIYNGAPFDAFFSADTLRAKKAVENDMALASSLFVYTQGKLVLYSQTLAVDKAPIKVLKDQAYRFLALGNPKTAPYGLSALQFLQKRGLDKNLRGKFVRGESIGQAFQYVVTGNAQIGFLAKSQVVSPDSPLFKKGHYWEVPQSDYSPLEQAAVLTKRGANNPAAKAFMAFMKTPEALAIMQQDGYAIPTRKVD